MKRTLMMPALAGWLLSGSALAQQAPIAPVTPPTAATLPDLDLPTLPPANAPAVPAPIPTPNAVAVPALPGAAASPTPIPPAAIPPAGTPTGELPSTPPAPAATDMPAAPTADVPFSYGSARHSLLFTPKQIENMKRMLSTFESVKPDTTAASAAEVEIVEALPIVPEPITEPTTYPVFFLSSIVYRTDKDWAVWVNNSRITPKSNQGEVEVLAVRPDRAWFRWKPDYIGAVATRVENKGFAEIDGVAHRRTSVNTSNFDRQSNSVLFSLRPNQSFAPGYFATFEGKISIPTLPGAQPEAEGGEAGQPPALFDGAAAPAMPPADTTAMQPATADAINSLLGGTPTATPQPAQPTGSPTP